MRKIFNKQKKENTQKSTNKIKYIISAHQRFIIIIYNLKKISKYRCRLMQNINYKYFLFYSFMFLLIFVIFFSILNFHYKQTTTKNSYENTSHHNKHPLLTNIKLQINKKKEYIFIHIY